MASSEATKVSLFRRSTIRVRLAAAFLFIAGLLVTLAAVSTWQLAELSRSAETSLRGQRIMGKWLAETQANAIRAAVLSRTEEAGLRQLLAPELNAATQRISALRSEVEGVLSTPRSKQLLAEVDSRRKRYLEVRDLVTEGKQTADNGLAKATADYLGAIEALLDFHGGAAAGESAAGFGAAASAQRFVLAVLAVAIVVGCIIGWKITSGIVTPLRFAAKLARQVAAGDLTTKVRTGGTDEAAQMLKALSDMMANLHDVVAEVSAGARTVTDRSSRLAAGHLDLSQRTEEQAATLEETASSMAELTGTVGRNAENARNASQLAAGASEVARKGGAAVGEVVATMTGISESSRKIADIIGVIDSIAFQTNILALNAAVEAARAGEQGRGFAVVAAEVRNLAQRSATAAKEIKDLIGVSAGKVEAGTRLVDAAGRTMQEIVASVKEVTELVAQIASASQEQRAGIEQVNTAVARMEQALQQNAALVDEATSATEAMKGEASALLHSVGRFKLAAQEAAGREVVAPAPIRARQGGMAPAAVQVLHSLALSGTSKYAGAAGRKES